MFRALRNQLFCFSSTSELVRSRRLTGAYKDVVAIELNQPKKKNALSISLLNEVNRPSDIAGQQYEDTRKR